MFMLFLKLKRLVYLQHLLTSDNICDFLLCFWASDYCKLFSLFIIYYILIIFIKYCNFLYLIYNYKKIIKLCQALPNGYAMFTNICYYIFKKIGRVWILSIVKI